MAFSTLGEVLVLLLLGLLQPPFSLGEYSRSVSYQNDIVVRCPDKNKVTVQVLRDHTDVWHIGKESIDMRVSRNAFARVQTYFPECTVIIEDLEAHVQAAETMMFPQKKAEQEAWLQEVVKALLPKGDLRECEAKLQEWRLHLQGTKSWFDEYHEYAEIVEWYENLAQEFPQLVTYNPSIGETLEGRSMPSVHFTAAGNVPDRKKFYMQCQIHAREWISGATCMYITDYFVRNYGVEDQITFLMDHLEFVLVPFVNPDGYVYTWNGDRMWRKNRNPSPPGDCIGIDINRNFPEGFRFKENCNAEDYGGPHAISELETRHIIDNFQHNAPIIGSIDFHSYGELILRPWGMENSTAPDEEFHREIGRTMVRSIEEVHGTMYTSEHSHDLYYCYGIAADWFYGDNASATNHGYRSASLCIELRDTADQHGFLLPADEIIPTSEEVLPGVIAYMMAVLETPLLYTSPARSSIAGGQQSRDKLETKHRH